jgi:hypothetical protein
MDKILSVLLQSPQPVAFQARLGKGAIISCYTKKGNPKVLRFHFERKIREEDVVKGRLLPTCIETVKRRGGKRSLRFSLDYRSAAALHDALGRALKESRRQQESEKIIDMLISWIMHLSQHKLLRTRPKVA